MRLPRPRIENCCVHVTHRCQKREFLLGYDVDRKLYRKRLFQATRDFPAIRVLGYVITSNHIHLLVYAPRMTDLSSFMKRNTVPGRADKNGNRTGPAPLPSAVATGLKSLSAMIREYVNRLFP